MADKELSSDPAVPKPHSKFGSLIYDAIDRVADEMIMKVHADLYNKHLNRRRSKFFDRIYSNDPNFDPANPEVIDNWNRLATNQGIVRDAQMDAWAYTKSWVTDVSDYDSFLMERYKFLRQGWEGRASGLDTPRVEQQPKMDTDYYFNRIMEPVMEEA